MWARAAAALGAVLLVAAGALAGCGRGREEPPPTGSRDITVTTSDGVTLTGVALGAGSDVAVLSHGATGTKAGFYGLAQAFADAGWTAIAYDARGVGGSTGRRDDDRRPDLRAVVSYARTHGAERVVLVGASMGGGLSLALARELDADGVVSLSAPASAYGALDAAPGLRGSLVLVVAAEGDHPYVDDARTLAQALGVEAVVLSGDKHGTGLFGDHPDLVAKVVAFAQGAVAAS